VWYVISKLGDIVGMFNCKWLHFETNLKGHAS